MLELIIQSIDLCLDFVNEELDLSRFCELGGNPLPELTEEELQEIEQRVEDWYMRRCNTI